MPRAPPKQVQAEKHQWHQDSIQVENSEHPPTQRGVSVDASIELTIQDD